MAKPKQMTCLKRLERIGGRTKMACLRYSTWRLSMSRALPKLSFLKTVWTMVGEKTVEVGQEMVVGGGRGGHCRVSWHRFSNSKGRYG